MKSNLDNQRDSMSKLKADFSMKLSTDFSEKQTDIEKLKEELITVRITLTT